MSAQRKPESTILRTIDDLRRHGGESMVHWLNRSADLLNELDEDADSFDERLKLAEAFGKLAERFCRFSGLDKPMLKNSGNMVVEVVRRAENIANSS